MILIIDLMPHSAHSLLTLITRSKLECLIFWGKTLCHNGFVQYIVGAAWMTVETEFEGEPRGHAWRVDDSKTVEGRGCRKFISDKTMVQSTSLTISAALSKKEESHRMVFLSPE
jgi:hypothetical protein